jgi:hypothetical protein
MPYVMRDDHRRIVAVSETAINGFEEQVPADDQQLAGFINAVEGNRHALAGTDLSFIRVLEDLIELLISKNTITFTDLPPAAQEKMLERQHLRDSMQSRLDLLDDEGEGLF